MELNLRTNKPYSRTCERQAQTAVFRGGIVSDKFVKANDKYLLAFDLDGTFLHAQKQDFIDFKKIYNPKKHQLVYVTGKLIDDLQPMLKEYAEKGIDLPVPDYFVANDGQQIFKINKQNNIIIPEIDPEWEVLRTGFNLENSLQAVGKLSKSLIIEGQPSITDISFHRSNRMQWYLFHHSLKDTIESRVSKVLKENKADARIIIDYVLPEDISKKKDKSKFLHMLDEKGGCYAFAVAASDKGETVKFLQKKLGIAPDKVITAGNAGNDISMTQTGNWFIAVNNSLDMLKKRLDKLNNKVIVSCREGLAGINQSLIVIFNFYNG